MKKNSKLIITIVIIIICVLGLVGYIIYSKTLSNNIVEDNNKKEENKIEIITSDEITTLGKELFDMINFNDGWYYLGHYPLISNYKNLTFDNLSEKEMILLLSIFRDIKHYDKSYNNTQCQNSSYYIKDTETPFRRCLVTRISKNTVKKGYYKLFGRELDSLPEYLFAYPFEEIYCYLSNNEYTCYQRNAGVGDDAPCDGGYIFVRSYMTSESVLIVEAEPYVENCSDDIIPEELIKIEDNNKHIITFKKNDNNDWYWYSSEIEKTSK